jgi:hypothetical protein
MAKHTLTIVYASPGDTTSVQMEQEHDYNLQSDVPVAGAAVDAEVDVGIIVAQAKSILLLADQNMTLKTNSSGAPTETVTLAANKPRVWQTGGPFAAIFASNVTKLFVTNTSSPQTAGTLKVRVLQDPTP